MLKGNALPTMIVLSFIQPLQRRPVLFFLLLFLLLVPGDSGQSVNALDLKL